MSSVWFCDLEKAVKALCGKTGCKLFNSITGNVHGDFIFKIDGTKTYLVKHDDFTVWGKVDDSPFSHFEKI